MGSDLAAPGVALVCQNGPWTHRHQDARHDVLVRETHADLAVLTETQITYDPADILRQPGAGAIWPGAPNFHCPGSGHTGGVAGVSGPSSHLVAPLVFAALDGGARVFRLDLDVCGVALSLVTIYGPAQVAERQPFYRDTLLAYMPADDRPLLLIGDFNCVLSSLTWWCSILMGGSSAVVRLNGFLTAPFPTINGLP